LSEIPEETKAVPREYLSSSRDSYDSAWKEAIVRFLRQFLALLFPAAYAQIDWSRKPEQVDTELRKVSPDAANGDQRADLLFKVYLLDGSQRFILAHVEVQTTRDQKLADRLFRYCYRIYDRYHHFVATFAVFWATSIPPGIPNSSPGKPWARR
jgi:hypothetical protein